MCAKIKLAALLALLAMMLSSMVALASDVSDAEYRGQIAITNNGTATTGVSANFSLNTQSLIDTGKINATATDTAIQTADGADVPFMPGYNGTSWVTWVPSIGEDETSYQYLYTGGVTGGELRYFPDTGGMTTADNASLELCDNFTIEQKGWVDTSYTPSIEDFTTYTEVDTNGKLTVTSSKADAVDADRDEDVYLYKDKGANYFDALDIDFEIYIASTSDVNGFAGMGIADRIGSVSQFVSPDLAVLALKDDAVTYLIRFYRGTGLLDAYTCSADTPYYCTLVRVAGNDSVSLKIYSDAARTTLVDTLVGAGYGTVKWQYIYGFVNWNVPESDKNFDGYVRNLNLGEADQSLVYKLGAFETYISGTGNITSKIIPSTTVTATGISSGERRVVTTADTANLTISVYDASDILISSDSTALTANVTDASANWTFLQNNSMPYMEYQKITIDGTLQQHIEWEYDDTTFTDLSGNSHDATPTFRTSSSDPDVSAELVSFKGNQPTTPPSPTGQGGWDILPEVPAAPEGLFTELNMSFWGANYIVTFCEAVPDIPLALAVFFYAFGTAILLGMLAWYISSGGGKKPHGRGSLLAMAGTNLVVMIYFVYGGGGVIPAWVLIPFGLEALAFIVWRQTPSPY